MSHELMVVVGETMLASSAALVLVLLLRGPIRALFGAGAGYASWMLVPIALIAVLLPAPVRPVAEMPMAEMIGPMDTLQRPVTHVLLPWAAIASLWGLGVLAAALLQLWQQRRFVRRLGPLRARGHGLHVAAATVGLPAVTGVLHPRIVLPADFLQRYDARERRLIVAHERQHIQRGDLACNAMVAVLRCVYWFNPLLHWAVARYRHDQELACDARVLVRHPGTRRTYAQAMLKTQLDEFVLPMVCHWHTHPMTERIAMLKRSSPQGWQKLAVNGLLLSLMTGVGYAAWAQQPMSESSGVSEQISDSHSPAKPLAEQTRRIEEVRPPYEYVSRPPPHYPKDAANAGVTGSVVVIATIAPDGHVTDATIERSEPAGVFDQVSLDAVRKWTFVAPKEQGKPVASRKRIPISFDLDPPKKKRAENSSQFTDRSPLAQNSNKELKWTGSNAAIAQASRGSEGVAHKPYKTGAMEQATARHRMLRGDIAVDGRVSNLRLEADRKPSSLERAMMAALGNARLNPVSRDGQQIHSQFEIDTSKAWKSEPQR